MKMLNNYSFDSLSNEEMASITGGTWWSDFRDGFTEGYTWAAGFVKSLLK